jgi:hypothetical protein
LTVSLDNRTSALLQCRRRHWETLLSCYPFSQRIFPLKQNGRLEDKYIWNNFLEHVEVHNYDKIGFAVVVFVGVLALVTMAIYQL